ncbi:hypothetical protein JW859_13275 [bacterium]|nr:hypothetical protein [bacterium]
MKANYGPTGYLEYLKKLQDTRSNPSNVIEAWLAVKDIGGRFAELFEEGIKNRDFRSGITTAEQSFQEIVDGIKEPLRSEVKANLALGELQLEGVNAIMKDCIEPYFGNVIIVNFGLTHYIYLTIKLLMGMTATFPNYDKLVDNRNVKLESIMDAISVANYMRQIIYKYRNRKPIRLDEYQEDLKNILRDERLHLLMSLYDYAIKYVVAHELGHYLIKIKNIRLSSLEQKEYEADRIGFTLLINIVLKEKNDIELTKALTSIIVVIQALEFIELKDKYSHSHPCAEDRINKLKAEFEFNNEYMAMGNAMMKAMRMIRDELKRKSGG